MLCRPPGLTKVATWMLPAFCGELCPARSTLTWPSRLMVTVCASAGIWIGGDSW